MRNKNKEKICKSNVKLRNLSLISEKNAVFLAKN